MCVVTIRWLLRFTGVRIKTVRGCDGRHLMIIVRMELNTTIEHIAS